MNSRMFPLASRLGVIGAAILAMAGQASAQMGVSGDAGHAGLDFLTINAASGLGSGSYNLNFNDPDVAYFNETFMDGRVEEGWEFLNFADITIQDGPNIIATFTSLYAIVGRSIAVDGTVRWGVDVGYSLVAGASDVTIEYLSPTLFFDAIGNIGAVASAGRIGTDLGPNSGISITPAMLGGDQFRALYNGLGIYASAFNTVLSNPNQGSSVAEDFNESGTPGLIAPYVTSIQTRSRFTVSANDSSGGTSTFGVVPAPGALALLGLSGLLAARRRR